MTTRDDRDEYLDSVLIGGREPVSISVVQYDEAWRVRYGELQQRVREALGPTALTVEHIGSTSVPGLAAKPIIDMLLTMTMVEDEPAYVPALEQARFELRVREPGHRMFRTPRRDAHLHVHNPKDVAVVDYLDLRDWLRESEPDRTLYAATKLDLARRDWSDMNHYADAKSEVILSILARAKAWRNQGDEAEG